MIAPSNCEAENFKFYNFLAQTTGTTTVAIYKGIIGDEGAAGSLQSTGQIAGALGAAQISGSTRCSDSFSWAKAPFRLVTPARIKLQDLVARRAHYRP